VDKIGQGEGRLRSVGAIGWLARWPWRYVWVCPRANSLLQTRLPLLLVILRRRPRARPDPPHRRNSHGRTTSRTGSRSLFNERVPIDSLELNGRESQNGASASPCRSRGQRTMWRVGDGEERRRRRLSRSWQTARRRRRRLRRPLWRLRRTRRRQGCQSSSAEGGATRARAKRRRQRSKRRRRRRHERVFFCEEG